MIWQSTKTQRQRGDRPTVRWDRLALAASCLLLAARAAHGADDVVVPDGANPLIDDGANGGNGQRVVVAGGAGIAGNVVINNGNPVANQPIIDQWFFPRGHAAAKRGTMETTLSMQLAELDRCCHLSDVQSKKLSLAMDHDVTQFFDDVEELRKKYPMAAMNDQARLRRELFPLLLKSQTGEVCGPGSFYEKALERLLDDEQKTNYRNALAERRRRRYVTGVEIALRDFEERNPFDARQHEAVRQLLVALPVPRALPGNSNPPLLLAMYRFSQLPSEQLEPLFSASDWPAINQARLRYAVYRENLQLSGLLNAGEP
ncbi:MAG TPA: hypothetical protein VMF30_05985 [Pirellulales bacterium]|nr:hypothetical protein [Pirellulales bacterium]